MYLCRYFLVSSDACRCLISGYVTLSRWWLVKVGSIFCLQLLPSAEFPGSGGGDHQLWTLGSVAASINLQQEHFLRQSRIFGDPQHGCGLTDKCFWKNLVSLVDFYIYFI